MTDTHGTFKPVAGTETHVPDEQPWYADHANLVTLTRWMVEEDYTADAVADVVEKPWRYEAEFLLAKEGKRLDGNDELGEAVVEP